MCREVSCPTCGKSTWAGCGDHADAVMAAVPVSDRCPGHAPDGAESESRVEAGIGA
jgi:hypothetical protein